MLDYWVASHACAERPARCDPASFTAAGGTLRATVKSFTATLIKDQRHLGATAPDDGSYVVVRAVTTYAAAGSGPADRATTDECVFDGSPLLGPNGTDGNPTVVSEAGGPHQFTHTLYLENGKWLVGDETVVEQSNDNTCTSPSLSVPVEFSVPKP